MKTPTYKTVNDLRDYFVFVPLVNKDGSISSVRTSKEIASELLLNNESIIKDGCVYYFAMKHLGLNVYEVKLRPKGKVNTFIVDETLVRKFIDAGFYRRGDNTWTIKRVK